LIHNKSGTVRSLWYRTVCQSIADPWSRQCFKTPSRFVAEASAPFSCMPAAGCFHLSR